MHAQCLNIDRPADAEVQNFGLTGSVHQNVGRLEVAMYHAALMGVLHGFAHLAEQLQFLSGAQCASLRVLTECPAFHQFHHEVRLRAFRRGDGSGVVHPRDPPVTQTPQQPGFMFKPA